MMFRFLAFMDMVETVSSLHPLISLHSSISMNRMDKFLQNMTTDVGESNIMDTSDSIVSTERFSHQESMISY